MRWLSVWSVVEVFFGEEEGDGRRGWFSWFGLNLSLVGSGFWVGRCFYFGRERVERGLGLWGEMEGKLGENDYFNLFFFFDS